MNVRNCSRCGRIFNYVAGQVICESCRKEIEKEFQRVKEFIRENPNQGITQVSEACDVSEKQIKQWVREERLEFSKGAGVLNCEKCGAPIATGRFCEKCKAAMTGDLNETIRADKEARKKAEKPKGTRGKDAMRFINEQ